MKGPRSPSPSDSVGIKTLVTQETQLLRFNRFTSANVLEKYATFYLSPFSDRHMYYISIVGYKHGLGTRVLITNMIKVLAVLR